MLPFIPCSLGLENKMKMLFRDRDMYIAYLKRRGFVFLAKGLYAVVLFHPKNPQRVIKVANAADGWASYVVWATQKRFAGGFAPKVYSLKFHNGFYVASMERLSCTISEVRDGAGSYNNSQVYLYRQIEKREKLLSPPLLAKFMAAFDSSGYRNDMHDRNVMVRHDGHVVVTDPSSDYFDKPAYRIKNGYIVQH
jgi:hypothetical protein